MKRIGAFLILFSSTCWAQQQNAADASKFACGDSKTTFDAKPSKTSSPSATLSPGSANVYLVQAQEQEGTCVKCGVTVKVGLDGTWVGATNHNSFLSFPVSSGDHHLCVNWQSKFDSMARLFALSGFTAEPGKIYYFRVHVRLPSPEMTRAFSLEAINADEGKYLVASAPPTDFKAR